MPDKLWSLFANNWPLLNKLFACATNTLLKWVKKLDIEIGMFVAMHTYGRQLNYQYVRDYREWCQFHEAQFQRRWKIYFAKKTQPARQNINYLGRYLKRPPIAAPKLRHYTGGGVVHHDYDHRTQQYRRQVLSQEEMLLRYISHIPSRHFKMVRYYGFLSNRKRGELLPKVYTAQGIEINKKPQKLGFASLMKNFTHVDPYECVLCGSRMVFNSAEAGIRVEELLARRQQEFKTERWLRQVA